ncbi:Cytoplasmic tRNA 2-thiolation protein 2 [Cladophialophora chaetospira]|uniref:Cytoplasmic tRNA 2-thiolation protein 2 n=1 Tax=Cladophialophora chaetospira TaxID=386627 RepID=A0AA38WXD8_9EURO|nr:Cytoplasmic tRNA 2-thiolation protein 2 [Cladophialophora chaetospira]
MTATTSGETCVDCQETVASLTIRSRRLCASCFIRYVSSKILKRMESYRFRNLAGDQKRRLFLPISGGVSSLVLLQLLDSQLQRQIGNRNRTAYDLVIARVVLPDTSGLATIDSEYQKLAQRFPLHNFLPLVSLHEVLQLDAGMRQDLTLLGIDDESGESEEECMQRILSSAMSVTARADLQSILLRRLLVSLAKQQNCETVLWGHSDSRLAAIALADVAKGRGGSVSSHIADGRSLHGINFNYPARDLFKVELQTYAQALDEPLTYATEGDATDQPTTSIRNTSIDNLLSSYITSQGEKYPSIMANVVRTASKLQTQKEGNGVVPCTFCIMPTTGTGDDSADSLILCYGCTRMKQEIRG